MARKEKTVRDTRNDPDIRDRKRDRNGWKAERSAARRAKATRRALESGDN